MSNEDKLCVENYTVDLVVKENLQHPAEGGVDVWYDDKHFMRIGGSKGQVVLALAKEIVRLRATQEQLT